ncbi:hypothetical protein Tco_1423507, partial [Tanacetum coccineum]
GRGVTDAVSPTADSPGYISKSDPEEDPADYPADGGDDDDDDDESSDDDEDDHEDVEEEKEEEEEHPAPADSVLPLVHCVTARMSIRDEPPIPFWSEAEVSRLLSKPLPLPSPLSSWSSPLPQIPSPPLLVSSPVPVSPPPLPDSPTYPLGYRAAMIWQRAESPSTSHSLPLTPPIILSHTSLSAPATRLTRGFRADYGFVANLGAPATDETELGRRMTNLVTTVIQDTNEIYGRLDEAQEASTVLSDGDCSLARNRPRSTGTAYGDTKTDEYTANIGDSTAGTAGTR